MNMIGRKATFICAIVTLFSIAESERILLIALLYPVDVRMFIQLGHMLTSRGHHITLVVPKSAPVDKGQIANLHVLTYISTTVQVTLDDDWINGVVRSVLEGSLFETWAYMYDDSNRATNSCVDLMQDEILFKTLEERRFEFALIGLMPCSAFLPFKLAIPYAQIHTRYVPTSWPSYHLVQKGTPFLDILCATVYGNFFDLLHWICHRTNGDQILRRPIDEFATHKFSPYAIFILRNELTDFPTPKPPHVIYTGHLDKIIPKPLPTDIHAFVEDAKSGVILVAFGSWLEAPEFIPIFLSAFRKLPYNVLIKSASTPIIPVPKNVVILPWLPVTDLLAHRNTKVIIYHGGLNTMSEAAYHGVPSIIIPFVDDHHFNAAISESKGYGKILLVTDVSSRNLQKTIEAVINNEYITSVTRNASEIIKHQSVYGTDLIENFLKIFIRFGCIFSIADDSSYIVNIDLYRFFIYVIIFISISMFVAGIAASYVYVRRVYKRKIKCD